LLHLFIDFENGGDKFLRNVGWISTDYMSLYHKTPLRHYKTLLPRRIYSSYSPPWEHRISHNDPEIISPLKFAVSIRIHWSFSNVWSNHHNSYGIFKVEYKSLVLTEALNDMAESIWFKRGREVCCWRKFETVIR
jgi:hypothetical protein